MLGHRWESNVSERRPRPWETPPTDAAWGGAERFGVPAIRPVAAVGIEIASDDVGFTVANSTASDLSVLVTLMARAGGADAATARAQLLAVTSVTSNPEVLRIADPADESAYANLWHDDVAEHERASGEWTAVRSGAVLVPLCAGGSFRLTHDADALRGGVVVAAVAAVGMGLDGTLIPVDRGPSASIGERPALPRGVVSGSD